MAKRKQVHTDGTVSCEECGKYHGHILVRHLKEEHNLTLAQYSAEHPDSPVVSEAGARMLADARQRDSSSLETEEREYEETTVANVMGPAFAVAGDLEVIRYTDDAKYVPRGTDKGYIYNLKAALALFYTIMKDKVSSSIWFQGYSGTGKTQLVLNVCRRLALECVRVNLDSYVTRPDLLGDWMVIGGETVFNYGLLPRILKRKGKRILLLDEYDLANPYVSALFRPLLETDDPQIVLLENGGEIIRPEPGLTIVATANTWGTGDTTGLYGTTQSLSLADRQRFGMFVPLGFLRPEEEIEMLTDTVKGLKQVEAEKIVQVANSVRALHTDGKIEESLSPRQLVNWAETYFDNGKIVAAARLTFLNPLPESSQTAIVKAFDEAGLKE